MHEGAWRQLHLMPWHERCKHRPVSMLRTEGAGHAGEWLAAAGRRTRKHEDLPPLRYSVPHQVQDQPGLWAVCELELVSIQDAMERVHDTLSLLW